MGSSSNSSKIPGVIIYYPNNEDYSYAHSVLQCLLVHPFMYEIDNFINQNMNNDIFNNDNNFLLTKELYSMNKRILKGIPAVSNNILEIFKNYVEKNKNVFQNIEEVYKKEPYNFMYYLFQFLHLELNFSQNNFNLNLFNISVSQRKDEIYIQNLYSNFINQCHRNSIIYDYFFNLEKITYYCINCEKYFDYDLKNIFLMDVPQIMINKKKNIINLDDCFDYYCNRNNSGCYICNRNNIQQEIKIINTKSLIIGFKRNKTENKCDIDFPINFDLSKYSAFPNDNNYILKSIISFNNGKYFAYINYNVDINTGEWFRYTDSIIKKLDQSYEIYQYQPQLLIYQLKGLETNINNNGAQNIQNNFISLNNNSNNFIRTNMFLVNNNNNLQNNNMSNNRNDANFSMYPINLNNMNNNQFGNISNNFNNINNSGTNNNMFGFQMNNLNYNSLQNNNNSLFRQFN